MITKICSKCGEEKCLSGFYDKEKGRFGKHAECKVCVRLAAKKWAEKYPSKKKMKNIFYGKMKRDLTKEQVKYKREEGENSLDNQKLDYLKKYYEMKIKAMARIYLNGVVQKGLIIKPESCGMCGKTGMIHGHHHDYSKPLDVIWVCPKCHAKIE